MTFVVLFGAHRLQRKAQAFESKELNELEDFSLFSSCVLTFIGMFFLSGKKFASCLLNIIGGSTVWLTYVLLVIGAGFLLTFYLFFGKLFGRILLKKMRKIISEIRKTVKLTRVEKPE